MQPCVLKTWGKSVCRTACLWYCESKLSALKQVLKSSGIGGF